MQPTLPRYATKPHRIGDGAPSHRFETPKAMDTVLLVEATLIYMLPIIMGILICYVFINFS